MSFYKDFKIAFTLLSCCNFFPKTMIRIWTIKRSFLGNVHTLFCHALFFSWIQQTQWVVVVYYTTTPLWYFNFASMAILYHAKRNVWAKYLPLLQFETNSGTTTHSVEKKIILLCMTFFILLMWLYLAVRKIQRRLQNTVHCKLPQKMGYLQIIPSSAWDGEWWDFGRNLNQEKKFALENFRNELCFLYDKLSASCFKIILISRISNFFSMFRKGFFLEASTSKWLDLHNAI